MEDEEMTIYDSAKDMRVVLRTTDGQLLETVASKIRAPGRHGELLLTRGSSPQMVALVPGELVLNKRHGDTQRILVDWGSLTAMGNEVRITVRHAAICSDDALAA
jgi:F0F1-type ATP synthase epsilon subunit